MFTFIKQKSKEYKCLIKEDQLNKYGISIGWNAIQTFKIFERLFNDIENASAMLR